MRSVFRICRREWDWMLRDKKYIALVMIAPILFVLVASWIYSHKKLTGLPILIVDQDHTPLSRDLTRAILANEAFSLAGYANSAAEFSDFAARDRARVCFVFERGLENAVKGGKKARIQVLVDNSDYLVGSVETANVSAVLASYSIAANVRVIEFIHGISKSSAIHNAMPLDLGQRMLFNPAFNSNYLNFMVPALAMVPFQLAALLAPIRAGSSEYGGRRFQPALVENLWVIVSGKVLAYVVILIPVLAAVLTIPHGFFGAPFLANRPSFWIALTWIAATMATLGYGLSAITRDTLKATEACAILTLPNFLLSGATWPVFAMSKVIWPLAYGFPMNSFAFMIKKITVMGGSLADCGSQIRILTAWSIVAVLCAWRGTRQVLNAAKNGAASNA